jgi:hypothetical protein
MGDCDPSADQNPERSDCDLKIYDLLRYGAVNNSDTKGLSTELPKIEFPKNEY